MAGRIRGYIACSLDGFIAGEGDDLSWLPQQHPPPSPGTLSWEDFMADMGALLMGRRTFDVVHAMDVDWPYTLPVLVATRRPLPSDAPEGVQAVAGTVEELLSRSLEVAAGADVYVDGGALLQQVMAEGRLEELVVTYVSTVLGSGVPLFAGPRRQLTVAKVVPYGDRMMQVTLTP